MSVERIPPRENYLSSMVLEELSRWHSKWEMPTWAVKAIMHFKCVCLSHWQMRCFEKVGNSIYIYIYFLSRLSLLVKRFTSALWITAKSVWASDYVW
jgi:hypothetical protein